MSRCEGLSVNDIKRDEIICDWKVGCSRLPQIAMFWKEMDLWSEAILI